MRDIKHYPSQYTLTQPMLDFFTIITNDVSLQQRLYQSKTLFEVSEIAKEHGIDIPPADIQKAQAGRVLAIINEKNEEDIQALLNGDKPKTGAQWGRGGSGYLDRPGHWFLAMDHPYIENVDDPNLNKLFHQIEISSSLQAELQDTKTINEMIGILSHHRITIDPIEFLAYYAQCILGADDELSDQMAR